MTATAAITLDLPLPPSKNELPLQEMARIRAQNRYKRRAWAAAMEYQAPTTSPPAMVRATAHFRTGNTWDEPNLWTALNLVLDALSRPKPGGPPPGWRQGIAERKGLIVDDSPRHLEVAAITQTVEPEAKRRGVTVRLEEVEG